MREPWGRGRPRPRERLPGEYAEWRTGTRRTWDGSAEEAHTNLLGIYIRLNTLYSNDAFMDALVALPPQAVRFLRRTLTEYVYPQLRRDPYWGVNIKKIRGYDPDTWRYRIGKFRVFFIVDPKKKIVFVLSVNYRRDAYR